MDFVEAISKAIANILQRTLGGDSLSGLIEFLVFLCLGILIWFIKPLSMLFSPIRRVFNEMEVYAGNYVQIIQSRDERRYSLIYICYNHKIRRYTLSGKQYDPHGRRAIDFRSDQVSLIENVNKSLDFVWQGEAVNAALRFDGYTKMEINDASDLEMLDGRGFFITFDRVPRRVNLRFVKMTDKRLEHFGLRWPKVDSERTAFVSAFHKTIHSHPELEPIEESLEPLIV